MLNLNFPIVFDDVFYSSDFTNRNKVRHFIENIYAVHHKLFGKNEQQELQIIFFTHDDLLLDAIRSATVEERHVIYARLFDYRESCIYDEKNASQITYRNLYNII